MFCSTAHLKGDDLAVRGTGAEDVRVDPETVDSRTGPGEGTVASYVLTTIQTKFGGVVGGVSSGDIIRQLREGQKGDTARRRLLSGALHWLTGHGWLKLEKGYDQQGVLVWRSYEIV